MDNNIKDRWVADLRSGKRTQGRGELVRRMPDGTVCHCVTGVLCEQAVEAGVIDAAVESRGRMAYGAAEMVMPDAVIDWAEMDDFDPEVKYQGCWRRLVSLNDQGVPFDVLATLIEEQL